MTKKLIINADDFGRTRGVSDGIIRAHIEGIITSTTAMMNMFGVANDLAKAKAQAPNLALGVHLTFTAGRPLLPTEWVGSLIDEHGKFLAQEAVIADPTHIDVEELKSELKSQIKTFNNAAGYMPDHLDAHHFVHVIPHLFAVYLDLADEFKLPIRIPFPRAEAALDSDALPRVIGSVPPEVVKTFVQADWELLAIHAARSTDRCFLNFYGDHVSVDGLLKILDEVPDGVSEIMTHPGIADDKLKEASSYNIQRETELAILCDAQVKDRIRERGIELTTFAAIS
jgi:predicted glycoside hydrolase/deacetylase ChbG (UPF0249 family)